MEYDKKHFRHLLFYCFDVKKTAALLIHFNLLWLCSIS